MLRTVTKNLKNIFSTPSPSDALRNRGAIGDFSSTAPTDPLTIFMSSKADEFPTGIIVVAIVTGGTLILDNWTVQTDFNGPNVQQEFAAIGLTWQMGSDTLKYTKIEFSLDQGAHWNYIENFPAAWNVPRIDFPQLTTNDPQLFGPPELDPYSFWYKRSIVHSPLNPNAHVLYRLHFQDESRSDLVVTDTFEVVCPSSGQIAGSHGAGQTTPGVKFGARSGSYRELRLLAVLTLSQFAQPANIWTPGVTFGEVPITVKVFDGQGKSNTSRSGWFWVDTWYSNEIGVGSISNTTPKNNVLPELPP